MTTIDVLYLCHGRLEFTKATLGNLVALTPWDEVQEFVVYNDAAPDHPETYEWLRDFQSNHPWISLRDTNLGSPVGVMLHFLARSKATLFAKIDNDIIVPPYWFETLLGVMERHPELVLLGMEPGMSGTPPLADGQAGLAPSYTPATHIGGVGMMRRSGFDCRPQPVPDGRFGFTEWQHTYEPLRGWVTPDMRCFPLDMIPVSPWDAFTAAYKKVPNLQRDWSAYDPAMSYYWEWWTQMKPDWWGAPPVDAETWGLMQG